MNTYKNILVVLDLSPDSHVILTRAKAVADDAATLTLLHVIEYVPLEPIGEALMPATEIESELSARATEKLRELAAANELTHCAQWVVVGSVKAEIQYAAQQAHADLIVVGNHGRQGLRALLNFTEDTVLHTAPCDVLAVRLAASR